MMFASIDIETGGLEPAGVAVLSVGAVAFDTSLYANVVDVGFWRLDARWTPGRRDRGTYEWWQMQKPDVYEEAIGGTVLPWVFAEQFSEWWARWNPTEAWANPTRFDFGHLRELYHQLGHAFPFSYKLERDLMTLKYVARDVATARDRHRADDNGHARSMLEECIRQTYEANKAEHSALQDAIEQANLILTLRGFLEAAPY